MDMNDNHKQFPGNNKNKSKTLHKSNIFNMPIVN